MKRHNRLNIKETIVKEFIHDNRKVNQKIGLRKLHTRLKPNGIGRDEFIKIGMKNNLGIRPKRSFRRTTFSDSSRYFPNLTAGLTINDINQVWCSDITYFSVQNKFYYITFIEDVYSRRIVGWKAHKDLKTVANCMALKKSYATRKCAKYGHKLIHHSDRGCQYTSHQYTEMLKAAEIQISTCNSVYENAFAERLNGIIKNEYLENMNITKFNELEKALDKAVAHYNNERPHMSLNYKSPVEYEQYCETIPIDQKDSFTMYNEPKIFTN